jgi:medium-chain acyl-[acyl-carrier-protein] hydrolase
MLPYVEKPFAIFGHSFGALVGFEMAREMRRAYGLGPEHLFVSGCAAPAVFEASFHNRTALASELLDGQDDLKRAVAAGPEGNELIRAMLPALMADYGVSASYVYRREPPLDCPLSVFGGRSDRCVKGDHLGGWQKETVGPFSLRLFAGDHFFVHSSETEVLSEIAMSMEAIINSPAR